MSNAIMVIKPYLWEGMWVFDDDRVGLVKEPFVAGVPEMIEYLLDEVGIADGDKGFLLTFSMSGFPGYQVKLRRTRAEFSGHYYAMDDPPMEGWLCPALFKYFDDAPDELYIKAEPMK